MKTKSSMLKFGFSALLFLALLAGLAVPTQTAEAAYATYDNPNYYYAAITNAPSGTYYRQAGFSPDGTQILAQKSWNDGTYDRIEIVIMNADGSGETVISPGDSGVGDIYGYMNPFWSDDGTAIGFAEVHNTTSNKIMRYDIAGGTTSYIYEPAAGVDANNPDFLGASKTAIVFWDSSSGSADLFTWDGVTLTNITNTTDYKEYEPVSNADGTVILYWSGETTAEPVNTTHTLTYSGGTWNKDVGFTPIADSYWSYWTTPAATQIALTVMSSKDIYIYDSTGAFVLDLSGPSYSGGSGQWNFFGSMPQAPNGEFVITSNAGRGATPGRDILIATPRTNLYVDDTGSDTNPGTEAAPFATIQKGINEALAGGTVHVAAGTYHEQITITKALTVTGEDGAVLDGTGLLPTWTTGVKIRSGNVTYNNIDVTNFTQDGITAYDNIDMPNLHITNSKISNIQPGYWGFGIYVGYESEGFEYSPPDLTEHLDFSGLLIEGNEITNVHSSALVVQSLTGTPGTLQVRNNYIHDNTTNSGIWIDCARNLLIENNTLVNNKWGIEFSAIPEFDNPSFLNGPYSPKDITLTGNSISTSINQGIVLYQAWPGTFTVTGNSLQGNGTGIDNQLLETLTASSNWWGAVSGPGTVGLGTGDTVSLYVDYSPWCLDATCTTFAPPFATTTTITADTPDASLPGDIVSVTATVEGLPAGALTPTGTVTVSGGVADCIITLVGGTGSCNITFDTAGDKIITATYNPDTADFTTSNDTETHGVSATPLPLLPLNGDSILYNRPTFDWSDYPGATAYQLQVSRNDSFTQIVLRRITTTSTFVATTNLPANTLLYWRVRARTGRTYGAWSEVWTFTTANPPSIPRPTAPYNNALVSTTSPLLNWTDSIVPAGTTFDHYQIQIATDIGFDIANIVHDNDIAGVTNSQDDSAVLTPGLTYFWRVRAYNDAGEYSGWSVVRRVRISPTASTVASRIGVQVSLPTFLLEALTREWSFTI